MSDPTRYRVANNQAQLTLGGNILAVDPFGPLVDYIDYARLKAEVERLAREQRLKAIPVEAQLLDRIKELKAEVERLTADLNKMTKTPDGVDYVEVDVGFWTKSGSRLPSSYRTFWSNDKGVQS